jgi:hypothetical protein
MTGSSIGAVGAELARCVDHLEESAGSLSQAVSLSEEFLEGCYGLDLEATAAQVELLIDGLKASQAGIELAREQLADILSSVQAGGGSGAPSVSEQAAVGFRSRPSNLNDYEQQEKCAEDSYQAIRADAGDVSRMADHLAQVARPSGETGVSRDEIAQVKHHLFVREQRIEDYDTGAIVSRRFDPDEEIAAAWIRVGSGQERASDLVLLEHELVESRYLKANQGANYQEAHRHANRRYNWNSLIRNG